MTASCRYRLKLSFNWRQSLASKLKEKKDDALKYISKYTHNFYWILESCNAALIFLTLVAPTYTATDTLFCCIAPRMAGLVVKIFVWFLESRIFGTLLLFILKRNNLIHKVLAFSFMLSNFRFWGSSAYLTISLVSYKLYCSASSDYSSHIKCYSSSSSFYPLWFYVSKWLLENYLLLYNYFPIFWEYAMEWKEDDD